MRYVIIKTTGLVVLSLLLITSICYGEKRFDEQGDQVAYGARFHEGLFDGYYERDGITTVSVNDTDYLLGADTLIKDNSKQEISIDQVEAGMAVNFFEVDREISKLWISKDQSKQGENLTDRQISAGGGNSSRQGQAPGAETGDGELKLENGVWTN